MHLTLWSEKYGTFVTLLLMLFCLLILSDVDPVHFVAFATMSRKVFRQPLRLKKMLDHIDFFAKSLTFSCLDFHQHTLNFFTLMLFFLHLLRLWYLVI